MWMEAGIFVKCSWQKCIDNHCSPPPTTAYCLNSVILLWLIVPQSSQTWWELAAHYSLCHRYNSDHVQNRLNLTPRPQLIHSGLCFRMNICETFCVLLSFHLDLIWYLTSMASNQCCIPRVPRPSGSYRHLGCGSDSTWESANQGIY
jgi:hypothetical protein